MKNKDENLNLPGWVIMLRELEEEIEQEERESR